MLKRFFDSPAGLRFQGFLIGLYVRLAGGTTRWVQIGRHVLDEARQAGGPVIVCFWHSRLLLVRQGWPPSRRAQPLRILISQSKDGEAITQAAITVGHGAIRGSSSKGAIGAMKEMLADLHAGKAVGVTPDGPRGPRMRAQPGAVQLAKRTGAPIIAFAWSTAARKVTKSWDRHVIPLPFGRGAFVWAGPLRIAKDATPEEVEAARLALEATLNDITEKADRLMGHEPTPPAAPDEPTKPKSAPAAA